MCRTPIAVALALSTVLAACGQTDETAAPSDASPPTAALDDGSTGAAKPVGTKISPQESTQPRDAGGAENAAAGQTARQPAQRNRPADEADAGPAEVAPMTSAPAKRPPIDATLVPWGVAVSASTSRMITDWAPTVAATGVRWVRGFNQKDLSSTLATLEPRDLALSGIFYWSPPSETQDTFPTNDLAGFQQYISALINESRGRVKFWEVWNEPPNFTADKSPASYAKIVQSAYTTTKAADPQLSVGLAAQSVNLNFLAQVLDAGARDHFDYITLHPYEVLGLVRQGWEAQFMSIVPTVRKLLADKNPAKKDVPIHFTELGETIMSVSPEQQADQLTKAFVLGLAQGVQRIHWFEVTDGDAGRFGLVDVMGVKRPAFGALSKLIEVLGEQPHYEGWALLSGQAYAFVFTTKDGPVAIAWAPPESQIAVSFEREVATLALSTAQAASLKVVTLTNTPLLIHSLSDALLQEARSNRPKPFPWGGDFSQATSVSYDAAGGAAGLHPVGPALFRVIDGITVRDMKGQAGAAFTVDPNFNSYTPQRLQIKVEVRRNGPAPASFTLHYESVSGSKMAGDKYEIPGSDQWYTMTWEVSDPQFVGMWGYHFALDSEYMDKADYSLRTISVTKL